MARYIYQHNVFDPEGNVLDSATVTVYLAGTDTLATIYTQVSGGSADADSAILTDSAGTFAFYVDTTDYAASQRFKYVVSKTGYTSQTWDYLQVIPYNDVEDAAYGAGWNGDTTHAPSQNAVYDKVEALDTAKSDKADERRTLVTGASTDQGNDAITNTLAWHIADADGDECEVRVIGNNDYDVTTNIEVPITMILKPEKGAILDGTGDLQINSAFGVDIFHQVFGTSITVTFKANGTTEIHPEWWGTFPNGSNDTTILNKAIAAADVVGSTGGIEDATVVIRQGWYYIAHSSISTITCNLHAPKAHFTALANSTRAGYLFRFDYSEHAEEKHVEIGTILGPDYADWNQVGDKDNIAITILAGDSCRMEVCRIVGCYIGINVDCTQEDDHVGMWVIDVGTIVGCDYGIHMKAGTTGGTDAAIETMIFNVTYMTYNDLCVALVANQATPEKICMNIFRFGNLELHSLANQGGIYVVGAKVYSNKFLVEGYLVKPTGTGYIVTAETAACDNLFILPHLDWTYIATDADAFNIYQTLCNHNTQVPGLGHTNDYGRSQFAYSESPETGLTDISFRVGDTCWNSEPADGEPAGWRCTVEGNPGTWETFGIIYS